jgi:biopolymer transport protein ExbD
MLKRSRLEGEDTPSEINIGPLIDIVFILLIFFVITTNFTKQTGLDVSKPQAKAAVSLGQKIILIGISREGNIHAFGRQVAMENVRSLVSQEIAKRPDISVVIVADNDAAIGKAVSVMDQCALAGVQKVSIAAEKE